MQEYFLRAEVSQPCTHPFGTQRASKLSFNEARHESPHVHHAASSLARIARTLSSADDAKAAHVGLSRLGVRTCSSEDSSNPGPKPRAPAPPRQALKLQALSSLPSVQEACLGKSVARRSQMFASWNQKTSKDGTLRSCLRLFAANFFTSRSTSCAGFLRGRHGEG